MSYRPDTWHAENDGSGSGLDADKLDNLSSADFSLVAHSHDLNDLDDVSITLLATGDVLMWDGVGLVWEEHTPTWGLLGSANVCTGATNTFDGTKNIVITPGAVPKISSTGILQLDFTDSYVFITKAGNTVCTIGDEDMTIGASTSTDFKIHEPTAAQWTVEAQAGALYLKGATGVWIDDGGTNDARAASVKAITSSATAPSGDYPYGALHLIWTP